MKIIVLDFETTYSDEFSLSKLSTQEYITDERFQVIGVAVQWADGAEPYWATDHHIDAVMATLRKEQDDIIIVCHNSAFDGAILSWHYGVKPAVLVDTMSMAKCLGLQSTVGGSLAKLAEQMQQAGIKVPSKGTEVINAKGKRREDFTDQQLYAYGQYAKDDVRITRTLFNELVKYLPQEELLWQSSVLKMYTEPMLLVNGEVVATELQRVRDRRAAAAQRLADSLGFADQSKLVSIINSNPKFAEALQLFGAEVPMKTSDATGKPTFALGIKDEGFLALLDHPVTEVRELVMARMGLKSSIEESRCEAMLWQAEFAAFPVPYRVSGARTHRLGGGEGGDEDGAERAMKRGKVNCMSGDHELLTPKGWMRIEDWQPDTPVMQWAVDGTLSWELSPNKVEVVTDTTVVFDAPFVRAEFTPDHRVIRYGFSATRVDYDRVVERTALQVTTASGMDYIPTAGVYAGGKSPLTTNQVRLLVALAADGTEIQRASGGASITFGFNKARKVERLTALLRLCGIAHATTLLRNEKTTNIRINTGDRPEWLRKGFGPWILELTQEALTAFTEEIVHWDGHANSVTKQPTFFTTLKDQAQWVATAWHLVGSAAAVYEYDNPNSTNGVVYHVYQRQSSTTSIDSKRQARIEATPGRVMYCPQVSTSYVLTRFKDRIHVTGQCQNLPSGRVKGQSKALRTAIQAPDGYELISADSSQIEVRVIDYMANDVQGIHEHTTGVCPYSSLAVRLYNEGEPAQIKRDAKKGVEPWASRRQMSKSARLSLQFGSGAEGFRLYCKTSGVTITPEEAEFYKSGFRKSKPALVQFWALCGKVLGAMLRGESGHFGGPDGKLFFYDGARTVIGQHIPGIRLPDGVWVSYPHLEQVEGKYGLTYRSAEKQGRKTEYVYLHGAKVAQQLTQAMAFGVMRHYATVIDYKIVLNSHDEHVLCVPIAQADAAAAELESLMKTAPPWAPGLPLDCEVHRGFNYGELK